MPSRRYASQGLFSARMTIQSCQKEADKLETLTIRPNDAGQRLDKFLTKRYKGMPLPLVYKYIRKGRVKRNGKRAKESCLLTEGDVLTLYIPEEFTQAAAEGRAPTDAFLRIRPSVNVVYEDENLLIADKNAGMLVHSDTPGSANTLIDHIQAYLYRKGEYDPRAEHAFAPALCNRIDRNTCGLVIAAKNAAALREMNEIIRERDVKDALRRKAGVSSPISKNWRTKTASWSRIKRTAQATKKPCRSTPFSDTTKSWTFPCWKSSLSPGGRTRSARSLPPRGIPCSGTGNTRSTAATAGSGTSIRRCAPTRWRSISPPRTSCSAISRAENSMPRVPTF